MGKLRYFLFRNEIKKFIQTTYERIKFYGEIL
jgi:hypothetical protein